MPQKQKPLLIAVGGLSGSGKTSLAVALQNAVPNAVHVDSDRTRKEIFGVTDTTRLPEEAYSVEATQRVIAEMNSRIKEYVAAGKNVVVSTTFTSPQGRTDKEMLANEIGAKFVGIWLQADLNVLFDRVARRVNDASDATTDILEMQVSRGVGDITWPAIDAGQSREKILSDALKLVKAAKEEPYLVKSPKPER